MNLSVSLAAGAMLAPLRAAVPTADVPAGFVARYFSNYAVGL
jgi:hypothetical protein